MSSIYGQYHSKENVFEIDKKIALAFGGIFFVFVLFVFVAGIIYTTKSIQNEQTRLSALVGNIVEESINRVSFSGKYQARIFIEEIYSKNPDFVYIMIIDKSGEVIAHSDSSKNGLILDDKYTKEALKVINSSKTVSQQINYHQNDKDIKVYEIDLPFVQGYTQQINGVIRIGISTESVSKSLKEAFIYFNIMILILTIVGAYIIYNTSKQMAKPIKNMAYQLEGILSYAPLNISIFDINGSIITFSKHLDETFALTQKNDYIKYNLLTEEDSHEEMNSDKNVFENGVVLNYEKMVKMGDSEKFFQVIKFPILKDSEGKISYICAISLDVTDRVKAQNELKKLYETLQERVVQEVEKSRKQEQMLIQQSKLASMGEMIGNIAHQWRQPLTSLALYIQDAKDAFYDDAIDEEYIENFRKNCMVLINKMSTTIDDFRNFFKSDKTKEEFLVFDSINDTLNILQASIKTNQISIEFDVEDECKIYGHKNEFAQVVLNILNNAKDVLLKNDINNRHIKIVIKSIFNLHVMVEIIDNGGGATQEVMEKMFEPYFTTKFKSDGTGIGLYMSKMIIEKSFGGKIYAENVDGGLKMVIEV
ncbi:MAG: hypothetical protein HXX81_06475 [Campylobacterales bacterium]|nr:hypothetical protein [Campylobacterales bacterium]